MGILEDCQKAPDLPQGFSHADSLDGRYKLSKQNEPDSIEPLKADGNQTVYNYFMQLPPLTQQSIDRLHEVQLFTRSHDQGHNPVPQNGIWTWFELAILENEVAKQPRKQDGIELTWISHINLPEDDQEGKIFGNNHAMLRSLKEGNVIAMRICARFDGWELFTESAYLMLDFGDPVSRSSDPSFGQIVSHTRALHEAFSEMNTALLPNHSNIDPLPDTVFQGTMLEPRKPLRVLSLDGGGVRGVAALILLDAVMKKIAPGKKPCEYFDMIGGTSTGGLISIMLGRFKMTIQECQDKYQAFMGQVFPHHSTIGKIWNWEAKGAQYDAATLEKLIKQVTKEKLGSEEAILVPEDWRTQVCKVLMVATKAEGSNNSAPAIFRSYARPNQLSEFPQIKIWEAARATSAAPTYFQPLTITDPTTKVQTSFLDGGLQANNPIGWLWNEILDCYGPAQPVSLFLSIGTGIPQATIAKNTLVTTAQAVASVATNSEISNILFRSLLNAFSPVSMAKKYWRLNVGDGMPDWVASDDGKSGKWVLMGKRVEEDIGSLDDVDAIAQTVSRAKNYIGSTVGKKMIDDISRSLQRAML